MAYMVKPLDGVKNKKSQPGWIYTIPQVNLYFKKAYLRDFWDLR